MIEEEAMVEIRVVKGRGKKDLAPGLTTPEQVYAQMGYLKQEDRENVYVLHLDVGHKIIAKERISVGTINAAPVHPREVFKAAILNNSAAIMLVHNHPSGSADPSPGDISLTSRIRDAGALLGIELLDHIIIGGQSFVSLRDLGHLSQSGPIQASVKVKDHPKKPAKVAEDVRFQLNDIKDGLVEIGDQLSFLRGVFDRPTDETITLSPGQCRGLTSFMCNIISHIECLMDDVVDVCE
jgi:DNA repair protein RadC